VEKRLHTVVAAMEKWGDRRKHIDLLSRHLLDAALTGNTAQVVSLLEQGAEVNFANDIGYTPLIAAARITSLDCVVALLQRGADVSQAERDGWTALTFAAAAVYYLIAPYIYRQIYLFALISILGIVGNG